MRQELCKALAAKDERGARRLDALKRATEAQRRAGDEPFKLQGCETLTERQGGPAATSSARSTATKRNEQQAATAAQKRSTAERAAAATTGKMTGEV